MYLFFHNIWIDILLLDNFATILFLLRIELNKVKHK